AMADSEIKSEKEVLDTSSEEIDKINAYRNQCLKDCGLYQVLNNLIQEYDPIKDKWEREYILANYKNITSLCLLSESKLASACINGKIKIFNLNTHNCEHILTSHKSCINALCLLPGNKLA